MLKRGSQQWFANSARFWRLALVFGLVVALAANLVGGSFSGIIHAHEHEHKHHEMAASDHHNDEHAAEYADDRAIVKTLLDKPVRAGGSGGTADLTHEHAADVVLCFATVSVGRFCGWRPARTPRRPISVSIFNVGPSERPPREVRAICGA